jgi:hypothetical protein
MTGPSNSRPPGPSPSAGATRSTKWNDFRRFCRDEIASKEDSDRKKGHRRTWDEWLYVRLGAPIAYVFLKTPISAPQVLVIMLLMGLLGPLLIMKSTKGFMIAGVMCLAISTWMDAVDGIVYRHRGQPAVRGAFLDRLNHALIYPLTYSAFGVAAFRLTHDWRYVPVGMAAGMFRDAYETLFLYETKFINENAASVGRVRASTFFRTGMYKAPGYWWVAPFFLLRNGTNLLSVHPPIYMVMVLAIAADAVPALTWYFLALYATRFFSYAVVTFGTTFRGK